MKKSYLAAAAILGAAVFAGEAHAVKIDLGKTKFKMGFRAKVHAAIQDPGLDVNVPFTRIYAKGSISKIFKWGWQMEFGRTGRGPVAYNRNRIDNPEFIDSFIMLDFAKEFKIVAGHIKLPFELHSGIQSGWSFLIPTGTNTGIGAFTNPADDRNARSGSRSPQLGIWGKIGGGLIKYYLTVADNDGGNTAQPGIAARIELAPTMMGYSGHPGYVLKETYLGKKNVLTLGVSYFTQGYANGNANSFGVDFLWEQKLGIITPNLQVGYVNHRNFRGSGNDRQALIVQGQILINQKTALGKPALSAKWGRRQDNNQSIFSVAAQLYVKGVGNRIALVGDFPQGANPTYTLATWFNF